MNAKLRYPDKRENKHSWYTICVLCIKEGGSMRDVIKPIDKISKALYIHSLRDWYDVPRSQFRFACAGLNTYHQYPSVEAFVRTHYPNHPWNHEDFVHSHVKAVYTPQLFMARIVRSIFPNKEIAVNQRAPLGIMGDHGKPLEIDVFVPELSLGFEYQDQYHYFDSRFGSLSEYNKRDQLKQEQAKEKKITIINVPFWWQWSKASLISTIKDKRPDLEGQIAQSDEKDGPSIPISEDPPEEIVKKYTFEIPGLGIPMLAHHIPPTLNPVKMLIFEKYDGMRAVWHSEHRTFYSRWGNPIPLPNYITSTFPSNLDLDGEIWFGREKGARFQALKVNKAPPHHVAWAEFKYVLFDTPHPTMRNRPYTRRYDFLKNVLGIRKTPHPYLEFATYEVCTNRHLVEEIFLKVREKGGEGIILRAPDSPYVSGYSKFLYKHKGYMDAEALVLRKLSDTRFLCRMLKSQTATAPNTDYKDPNLFHDVEMTIATDDEFEGEPANILPGTFVSFKYLGEYNAFGPPLNPTIFCVRGDVTNWTQLVHANKLDAPSRSVAPRIWNSGVHTHNWTDPANRKKVLDEYAKKHNFDPLVAANWYNVSSNDLIKFEGGTELFGHYGKSMVRMLTGVYPDIGIDPMFLKVIPAGFWTKKENRRRFLDVFAAKKGFDPLIAENWYSVKYNEFVLDKAPFTYYSSYKLALMDLYPFIGLELNKFPPMSIKAEHWDSQENCRKLFQTFAREKGFDPLDVRNWYKIRQWDVVKFGKGFPTMLERFAGRDIPRVPAALINLFPELNFDISKFKIARSKKPKS